MAAMSQDILNPADQPVLKTFRREQLLDELEDLGWKLEDLRWWVPRVVGWEELGSQRQLRLEGFIEKKIPEDPVFQSEASTFCFENRRLGQSRVLLLEQLAVETL